MGAHLPHQRVVVTALDGVSGTRVLAVPLAEGTPLAVAGGGWSFQRRARRKGMTEWLEQDPYTLAFDCEFDGWAQDRSVEPEIETLRRWMRVPVQPHGEPTRLTLSGPVPLTQLTWVLNAMEPTGMDLVLPTGQRARARFTLTFMEHVPGDVVLHGLGGEAQAVVSPAATAKASASVTATTTSRTYTVRPGETLTTIAVRELGNAGRWTEIAAMNDIRDPNFIQAGQVLRLP